MAAMGLLGGESSLPLLTSFQLSPVTSFFLLVQFKRLKEHLASPGNGLHDVILSSNSASWMEILLDSLGCGSSLTMPPKQALSVRRHPSERISEGA